MILTLTDPNLHHETLFFLFKLFLGIPLLGLAQNHFEGFIYDAKTKEPLPFVHFIYEGNKGFISNQKGAFLFYSTRDQTK